SSASAALGAESASKNAQTAATGPRVFPKAAVITGSAGPSEFEDSTEDRPVLDDVVDEPVMVVIDPQRPIAQGKGDVLAVLVSHGSQQVPGHVGPHPKAADQCPAVEEPAVVDVVAPPGADDRVDPRAAVAAAEGSQWRTARRQGESDVVVD